MRYGFFDGETVKAEDFAAFVRGILTNGVTGDSEDVLKVTAGSGMTVNVNPGYVWINGRFGNNESTKGLTLATASGTNGRIDRVVARLDLSISEITLAVLTGTASASSVAPALTRDGTIHELCLAEISIPAGTTAITNSLITDTRTDKSLCGAVVANTRESLALDGKADKSDITALNSKINTNATNISDLQAKRLISGELLSSAVSGTKTVDASVSSESYGFAKIKGTVTVSASDGVTTNEGTEDFELFLLSLDNTSITLNVTVDKATTEVNISATSLAGQIRIAATSKTATVTGIVVNSVRGVYIA